MELGKRSRAVLGIGALAALAFPLATAIAGNWMMAAACLAAALSALTLVALGILWRSLARAHDHLQTEMIDKQQQYVRVMRETRGLNRQLLKQTQQVASQLEQISLRAAFPALGPPSADDDAVSTRFADYLSSPRLRESDRMMALLELVAKDAVERRAVEEAISEKLDALNDSRASTR